MLGIHPFLALRPTAARARTFSCGRLDHLGEAGRSEAAARMPESVAAMTLHDDPETSLQAWLDAKVLLQEPQPTMFMHRQVRGGRRAAGVVALLEPSSLQAGTLRSMRQACPVSVDWWKRVQGTAKSQMESVIVGFHRTDAVHDLFEREMNDRPIFHVVADDGGTHTLWRGQRAAEVAEAFRQVSRGYVLEGHATLAHAAADGRVMAMLLPLDEVTPHWSTRCLGGDFGERLAAWIKARGTPIDAEARPQPGWAHACLPTVDGSARWMRFQLPPPAREESRLERTDHRRLDAVIEQVAGPDALRMQRWERGEASPEAIERRCGACVAIMLAAPDIGELTALADEGSLVPAGSTWFQPRIRSGLWLRRTTMTE